MSFFAGLLALSGAPLNDHVAALESVATLHSDFLMSRYCDPHFLLIHGDLGALPEKGWRTTETAVAALAGSLHLTPSVRLGEDDGQPELARILECLRDDDVASLVSANGTFALCFYNRKLRKLILAADCLGARPIYYAVGSGILYFSTSLAVLEKLDAVPKTFEVAAYVEQEALCYPLEERTLYREIRVVTANQMVIACDGNVATVRYFDWAHLPMANEPADESAAVCRRALHDAVACRTLPGKQQATLLSGGLDSRVLAAELLDLGYDVAAVNIAPEGFQDRCYARQFAECAGILLTSLPWSAVRPGLSTGDVTANLITAAAAGSSRRAVFSGDGGGETFGFLLMDAEVARLLRQGKRRAAVDQYLNHYHLSSGLFTSGAHRSLRRAAHDRMERALSGIGGPSEEKSLHVLVLSNDLRCHLHEYFSRIQNSRVELLLPFYDRRVIASVLRLPPPLEPLMKHAFYHRMLALLPPLISAAPWQTYPGHVACPVEDKAPPRNQWSMKSRFGDVLAWRCLRLALSPGFPAILRRSGVFAAVLLHWARWADYTYFFKACININALAGGERRYVLIREERAVQ